METLERQLAKDRIRNASRASVQHGPELASIGTQGAIAYALLEIANAIRSAGPSDEIKRLLAISDSLVEAALEGADQEKLKQIAMAFKIEREGVAVDQISGIQQIGKLI